VTVSGQSQRSIRASAGDALLKNTNWRRQRGTHSTATVSYGNALHFILSALFFHHQKLPFQLQPD